MRYNTRLIGGIVCGSGGHGATERCRGGIVIGRIYLDRGV